MAHNTETVPLPVISWQGHGFSLSALPEFRDITVTWTFSQMHHGSQFGQRYAPSAAKIQSSVRKIL